MLTEKEIVEYERRVSEAKQLPENIETAEALQKLYRADKVQDLVKTKGISEEEAEQLLPRLTVEQLTNTTKTLSFNDTVEIAGSTITVSELVERGEEFDGKAMPDPIEGSGYGTTTAKYFHNEGIGPCIHSFAHGVKTIYKIQNVGDSGSTLLVNPPKIEIGHLGSFETLEPDSFPDTREKKGDGLTILNTLPNHQHLYESSSIVIQWNPLTKEILINIPNFSGTAENSNNIKIAILESLAIKNGMSHQLVPKYVAAIADANPINLMLNWILSKVWDGVDRLQSLFDTVKAEDDYPVDFKELLVHLWLLSVVAAATISNGFRARGILVFQGNQSIGKTTWFGHLMPPGLLRDQSIRLGHHLDPHSKDSITTAIKHLIVEIGELDSSMKRDSGKLKSFITLDRDSIRRPYAATNSEYPRRTVFCATVNDSNFLLDTTGNSRFWTIPVISLDYEHGIDMQQVYAQLYVELQQGAQWWLTREQEQQLEELNRPHRAVSAIEELVMQVMNPDLPKEKWRRLKPIEVLMKIGFRTPTNRQCKECADVLRHEYGGSTKVQGYQKFLVPYPPESGFD